MGNRKAQTTVSIILCTQYLILIKVWITVSYDNCVSFSSFIATTVKFYGLFIPRCFDARCE